MTETMDLSKWIKEAVAAILALVIVVATVILALGALDGKTADEFEQSMQVLTIFVGLAGTVIGYYFGRVPAERAADAARGEADALRSESEGVRQEAGRIGQELEKKESNVGDQDLSELLREATRSLRSVAQKGKF